jgi:hypothetical protein
MISLSACELSSRTRAAHQFCQCSLALLDWRTPQIFAVESDQVECDRHGSVTVALVADEIE